MPRSRGAAQAPLRYWRRLSLEVGLLVMLAAPALKGDIFNPQLLLDKLRLQIASTVQNVPRYTCVESIERYWYANRKPIRPGCDTDRAPEILERNLIRTDRLRLDVAVGSGQEIFSWRGEKAFRSEEIDQVVTNGPISSGTYFSFLSDIFLEGLAKIDFIGLQDRAGKEVASFDYSVARAESKFETRTRSGKDVMGYHGRFLVDVATGELKQLDILTDDMPPEAGACSFDSRANYGVAVLGGIAFQLPTSVVMDVLQFNHELTKTVTRYQQCRQFLGESVLRFDADAKGSDLPSPSLTPRLPSRLNVDIRITSAINPSTAWAGDPVDGVLAADILNDHGSAIVPKGAVVHGRLLRLESWNFPAKFYTVAIQFQQLSWRGADYMLDMSAVHPPDPTPFNQTDLQRRIQLNNPPISDQPGACRFRLSDKQVKLTGVVTHWVTN